jgi:hypothetical protein
LGSLGQTIKEISVTNLELQKTIKRLEKRIDELEDIEKIKELHRNYIYYVNQWKYDDVINCFAEDAIVDLHGHYEGKAEIAKLFKGNIAENLKDKNWGHFITQPVISISGKKATGYWLFYCFMGNKPPTTTPHLWAQARHDCKYIKTNDGWKFTYLKFTTPWPKDFKGLVAPGLKELKFPD